MPDVLFTNIGQVIAYGLRVFLQQEEATNIFTSPVSGGEGWELGHAQLPSREVEAGHWATSCRLLSLPS